LNCDEVWSNLVALLKIFPTVCCTLFGHTRVKLILDFLWSRVKVLVWLRALLLTITCASDVWMAHARPFSTSTLQGLSNDIKNTSRRGVWPLQSSSEIARVPEDSKFSLLGMGVSSSHLPQSGVATKLVYPYPLRTFQRYKQCGMKLHGSWEFNMTKWNKIKQNKLYYLIDKYSHYFIP